MESERRDLAMDIPYGDYVASARKGGFICLDGTMEVRFEYRGRLNTVILPPNATREQVRMAIIEKLPAMDDEITLTELVGAEI